MIFDISLMKYKIQNIIEMEWTTREMEWRLRENDERPINLKY